MGYAGAALFGTAFIVSVALLVTGALLAISGDPTRSLTAFGLLGLNLALIVVLGSYLVIRVWSVLAGRTGQAAPILYRRFVTIFSLIALAPAMLVGIFSTSLITQNIDDVFGEGVRSNMEQARAILDDYVSQELEALLPKMQVVRSVVAQNPELLKNRISASALLQRIARDRNIDSIYLVKRNGNVLARVEGPETPELRIPVPGAFDLLQQSRIAFQSRDEIDYLMALSKLDGQNDIYLYIGDYLRQNAGVLSSISGIESAGQQLDRFNTNTRLLNRTFFLTMVETALLVLMAAVILGSFLATRIIEPLSRLISASERVTAGDLTARARVERDWGEVSDMGEAFNRMTEQLSEQRADLIREHGISERQRLFSEAVLSGVTAGIIGLSDEGRVTLANASAARLLEVTADDLVGKPIELALPEFATPFRKARESLTRSADDQVDVPFAEGPRTFDLRVSSYEGGPSDVGWVLTFDDMTRLVAAQRHSAWREVARRIAHEIKNPLTPIQLSAERLQMKFGSRSLEEADRAILERGTNTILRAVGNLERIVDEFSAFARMPEPVMESVDVDALLSGAIAEQGVAFPNVSFAAKASGRPQVIGDFRLMGQAMTNLIKNAAESVERAEDSGHIRSGSGRVHVSANHSNDEVVIAIEDNGMGWPEVARERLLEPYVTTRAGGTGLGLAIVQRIVEDHGGTLDLLSAKRFKRGACARITLPTLFANRDAA